LYVEAIAALTREIPQVATVVLDLLGHQHPGGVGPNPVEEIDRFGPQVLIARLPANLQPTILGDRFDLVQLHHRGRHVHFDNGGGSLTLGRWRPSETVAVGHDQANAEHAFTRQIDIRRAAPVRILAKTLPCSTVILGDVDVNLADAALADVI